MYSPSNDKSKAQAATTQGLLLNLEKLDQTLGPKHPESIAAARKLSEQLMDVWEDEAAEPYFQRVCDYYVETQDRENPETLSLLFRMAELQSDLEHESQATHLYLRVLEARVKVLGPEHPDTLESLVEYAEQLIYLKEFDQAQTFYTKAVETAVKVFGPDDRKTREYQTGLAVCHDLAGMKSEIVEPPTPEKKGCASSAAMFAFVLLIYRFLTGS